jgi:hypothetical protein
MTMPAFPRDVMTAVEFDRIEPQPCPVCGATVDVEQVDVTPNAEYHAKHGRCYVAGPWSCPHGCNPETQQRYHGGYRVESDDETTRLVCTCGGVSSPGGVDQFLAAHPVGQFL